jgi:hypothetical protein
MSRALLILANNAIRAKAKAWVDGLPDGTRVEFSEAKRSTEQSDLMWACLTDISRQTDWHGIKLSPDDWKLLFMSALNSEMRIVPNMDGTGFVNLGNRSSKLSKAEMSNLIELIFKFGAERGIKFHAPRMAA